MTHGSENVGLRRWRETFGRYFEDFEVGDVYEHRPGRTITDADNTWFTLLTMNKHPLHFDDLFVSLVAAGEQAGALETLPHAVGRRRHERHGRELQGSAPAGTTWLRRRCRQRHAIRGFGSHRKARIEVATDAES
jgi:hypothetical protein